MKLIFGKYKIHVIYIQGNVYQRSSYPKHGIVLLKTAHRRSDVMHRRTCNKIRPCDLNPKTVSKASENKELSFVRSRMKDFFSFTVGRTDLTKIDRVVKCLASENVHMLGLRMFNLKMKSMEHNSAT